MSASNQKKIRKEKAMAYMSERQRKEAEEQKKLKRYTVTFWIILALCVCIVLSTVLTNPVKNVVYRNTTAVTIGNHELSATEVNYFYIDAINAFCNQYSYYLSYMLDTSKPLSQQAYDNSGATWADNFLNSAIENIKSTYQLYDLAVKNGFTLSDEEKASIETAMSNIEIYATYYQYNNANAYLRSVYGNGANVKTYRQYYEICAIANAYYTAYSDSLEYEEADLRAYEADKLEQYNSYTFAYYYFKTDSFLEGGTKGEDGKTTYSDEEKAAAQKVAEELANQLAAGTYEDLDAFDKAINEMLTNYFAKDEADKDETSEDETGKDETAAPKTGDETTDDETTGDETTGDETTGDETTGDETTGDETTGDEDDKEEDEKEETLKYTSTKQEDILYSKLNSLFVDWLIGKETSDDESEEDEDEDKEETLVVRQMGDLTVIVNETTSGEKTTINGYYVLRFGSVSDNTFKLKDVRHILVEYEGGTYNSTTGKTTYSDAEKKAAKEKAEKLLAEFKGTAMTEEIFAEMAKEHSADTGSQENGGLYEEIYPGQMVTNFNDWCFDETRKVGDVGIVQSDYGYHIMYYVGESETNYRDYMIENDVRNDELTKWMEDLIKSADLVQKNLKYVNKDLVLSSN